MKFRSAAQRHASVQQDRYRPIVTRQRQPQPHRPQRRTIATYCQAEIRVLTVLRVWPSTINPYAIVCLVKLLLYAQQPVDITIPFL